MHTCSAGRYGGRCWLRRCATLSRSTRVHPMKMLGHHTGLVALHRADAVPLQGQVGQGCHFVDRFLTVPAKGGLSRAVGLADGVGTKGLGNSQHRDALRRAPVLGAGQLARARAAGPALTAIPRGSQSPKRSKQHALKEVRVDITQPLAFSVKNKASDLHLSSGSAAHDPRAWRCAPHQCRSAGPQAQFTAWCTTS